MSNNNLFKRTLQNINDDFTKTTSLAIIALGYYRHEADEIPFYRDFYPNYQMFYCISGKGWIDYMGKYITINPGEIVCIDLKHRHGMGACQGFIWEYFWIQCNGALFDYMYNTVFKGNYAHTINDTAFIFSLFDYMFNLKSENYVYFNVKATGCLIQIFDYLLQNEAGLSMKNNENQYNNINAAIKYINDNYYKDFSINELSKVSGYSEFHFCRLFKKYIGLSPFDYLIKVRINKAKDLLLHTDLPLDIISEKIGFNSQSYFTKVFKKHESLTPSYFRKYSPF